MEAEASERARIVDAAYRCLAARPGGISVTDILTAAGLSTRAFYRHFESKDSLLLALYRQDGERVDAELRAATAAAGSPREAMQTWIRGFLELTAHSGRRRRVTLLNSPEVVRAEGYPAEHTRVMAEHKATIAQILREGHADGSFPAAEPETDARLILAVVSGAFTDRMSRPTTMSATKAAELVTDFVFRALGAEPR
ncbi:TetR/AcrR family transcriptional regulator [Actinomadura madurae]|uniref:TetR/AcrR family transcriptional regulator n=1 Tax=Actinomadura madurae TaxID=1993 RepID=UPI00399BD048